MTELKTLDDLRYSQSVPNNKSIEHPTIDEIRQEAIEWIKYFQQKTKIEGELSNEFSAVFWKCSEQELRNYLSKIAFIKDFFNIKEGDLK